MEIPLNQWKRFHFVMIDPMERRIKGRKPISLRVDLRILPPKAVEDILDGAGYNDLSVSALALPRPRSGMQGASTFDISLSGFGVACKQVYERGCAAALDVHLPGQRTVLKFLGEVMWSGEVDGSPRAGIRIAALDLDSAERFGGFLSKAA
jgi:hypothetical protein